MKNSFRMTYSQGSWLIGVILFCSLGLCGAGVGMVVWFDASENVAVFGALGAGLVAVVGLMRLGSVPVEASLWQEGIRIQALRRVHPYRGMNRTVAWYTIERASVILPEDHLTREERTLTVVVGGYSFGLEGPAAEVESMRATVEQMLASLGRGDAVAPSGVTMEQELAKSKVYQLLMWATAGLMVFMLGTWVLSLFGMVEVNGPFPWGGVAPIGIGVLVWVFSKRRGGGRDQEQ